MGLSTLSAAARREVRAAMCDGKDRLTHDKATKIAARMRRTRKAALQPYRCPACRDWHVGSPPGKR